METKLQSVERKEKEGEKIFDNEYAQIKNFKQNKQYRYTPTDTPYDVLLQSGGTTNIGEIKKREYAFKEYFDYNGPYLELKKIEGMQKQRDIIKQNNNIDCRMLYFNITKDYITIYQLNEKQTYNFKWEYLPKDNYSNEKEWKMVTPLPFNQIIETIKR